MSLLYIIFIILGIGLGGIAYYVSDNILYFALISLLFIIVTVFLICPMVKEKQRKSRLTHECYRFINDFVITMSATLSLEKSYLACVENAGKEFSEVLKGIDGLDYQARLDYLKSYFDCDLYQMFLSLMNIYFEQGGDVLALSSDLLGESTRVEETRIETGKVANRQLFEYIVLWAMSIAILTFLRVAMDNFFSFMKESLPYLASVMVYFVFLLVSMVIYASAYTGERIGIKLAKKKGGKKHEKSKKKHK